MSEQETRTYEELLEERNRLWEELQRRNAVEADLAYWRGRAADLERSRWWRAGEPLREGKRLAIKAVAALRRRDS